MALNFPNNPEDGQSYTGDNGVSYTYDGTKWVGQSIESGSGFPTASTTVAGIVKVDGTTITIDNGVISSTGGTGSDANTGNVVFDGNQLYVGGTGFLNLDNGNNQAVIGTNGLYPLLVSLNEGDKEWTFDPNGHITFPDGSVQVTAYTGSGNSNVWIQDFETPDGSPADVVGIASSVEYLDNGDLVALFNHYINDNSGRYNSVARFDSTGTKIWAMRFAGDTYTDGWGLAVDNVGGFIYVAGKNSGVSHETGTLTKLNQDNGSVVWSKLYDVGVDNTNAVVDVASDGNPVVVGYANAGANNQVVTTKIDASTGAVIWSRSLDGQNGEEAYGMAVGPSGEVVAVGYMDNIEYELPVDRVLTLTANPPSDVDWTINQSLTVDGVSFDISFTDGVASFSNIVDTTGGRYVGQLLGQIDGINLGLGSVNLELNVGSITAEDMSDRMLVVKYDNTGTIQWQKAVQVEVGFNCGGADADIDGDGNIYVCGSYTYDAGGPTYNAMIIIKFNSSGVKQWSRKVVGNCDDWSSSIVVGPDNCLYLSAVTGNNPTEDFSLVVAKYNLDGTVAWQRLLDNTTSWTFAGGNWFGPGGQGSTLAVKQGYVAVVGGFADPFGTVPHAILAQFDSDGTVWSAGNYDFKAATFTGLLNGSASNITVDNAGKTDSNYASEYFISNYAPDTDSSNFLLGTLYSQGGGSGTGDITFSGVDIRGDGDNSNSGSINLVPNSTLKGAGQYINIYPTNQFDYPHVHIAAGMGGELYIGNDNQFVKTDINGNIAISAYNIDTSTAYVWNFGTDGATTFPTLTVPISDNANPSGTGQTLKFSDPSQQAIIFGPASTESIINAERVIIQGAPGYTGTSGEGGDVYLWAGPGGDGGGDGGDIKIRAGRGNGTASGGYLYFQTGSTNTGYAGSIRLETGTSGTYGQGGPITLDAKSGGEILLRVYNSEGNSRDLILSNAGTLTLPGAVVKSTVAKTGGNNTGEVATVSISPSNNTNLTAGVYSISVPVIGVGAFSVDITVAGNGDISGVVTNSPGGFSVGTAVEVIGGAVGGTTGVDDITVTIASLTNIVLPTAIDLTKSINKLTDGAYSLADGTEGQIMYLIRQTGSAKNNIVINVANARIDGILNTTIAYYPFENISDLNMSTLIFTDGAWQASNGGWD